MKPFFGVAPVVLEPTSGEVIEGDKFGARFRIRSPLDFYAVSDHAEMMGTFVEMTDPDSEISKNPMAERILSEDENTAMQAFAEMLRNMSSGNLDPAFSDPLVIYRGPDLATFLSGLPDGTFHYRIRAIGPEETAPGRWSSPVTLEVKHHSLRLAFLLFGLGAVVFLLTVGIVIQGNRRTTTR